MVDTCYLLGENGEFAKRLRKLMDANKTTQQDLSEVVGVTRQQISNYRWGKSQPTMEQLFKLAQFFKVSADYLLGLADEQTRETDVQAINKMTGLSEKAINILRREIRRFPAANCGLCPNTEYEREQELNKWNRIGDIPRFRLINFLLEESLFPDDNLENYSFHKEDSILWLINRIFSYKEESPKAYYEIHKVEITPLPEPKGDLHQDIVEKKCSELRDPISVDGSEIFYFLLLKLQQLIINKKTEIDNKGIEL